MWGQKENTFHRLVRYHREAVCSYWNRWDTWLFVDCPHIQLKGPDAETPQHFSVHHLERRISTQRQLKGTNRQDGIKATFHTMKLTHRQIMKIFQVTYWITPKSSLICSFLIDLIDWLTDSLMTLSKNTSLWAKKSNTKYWRGEKVVGG